MLHYSTKNSLFLLTFCFADFSPLATAPLAIYAPAWYTSTMSVQIPEKPRGGKYCPRCRAMNPRGQAVCGQCGHHFRSGAQTPVAGTAEPDPVNRTMQFTLPPLPSRTPTHPPPVPAALPEPTRWDTFTPPRMSPRVLAAVAAALALGLIFFLFWQRSPKPAPVAAVSPVGVWETTLTSQTSADAHLEFALQTGGTGRFSWRETGPTASSGQTPLVWRQNPNQTLTLTLTAPQCGDAVSQTLVGIFSSHPWAWQEDPAAHRLTLGTLVFTEKL